MRVKNWAQHELRCWFCHQAMNSYNADGSQPSEAQISHGKRCSSSWAFNEVSNWALLKRFLLFSCYFHFFVFMPSGPEAAGPVCAVDQTSLSDSWPFCVAMLWWVTMFCRTLLFVAGFTGNAEGHEGPHQKGWATLGLLWWHTWKGQRNQQFAKATNADDPSHNICQEQGLPMQVHQYEPVVPLLFIYSDADKWPWPHLLLWFPLEPSWEHLGG